MSADLPGYGYTGLLPCQLSCWLAQSTAEDAGKVMKACMVGYAFYETDNRIRRYAEALVSRGDEVDAIVLGRPGQKSFEVIKGVRVYRIQTRVRDEKKPATYLRKVMAFFFRSSWALAVRHLKARYDIVHVHSVPDFEVFAAAIPRLMGAKVILDIHDIVPEFYASKFKVDERSLTFRMLVLVERLSSAFANHVIISNDLWRTRLVQRSVPGRKCTAIINYPDPAIFSPRPQSSVGDGRLRLCYPGTLNWHQGVDIAVEAMALLRHRFPEACFLIMGDGPDRQRLERMVREKKLEGNVTIAGSVSLEEVATTMATVDLGIVPKRNDSFGGDAFSTKVMEFMAVGVPVVLSRTRVDRHYFNDSLVQFFEPGSAEDLADKIIDLARNRDKRESLREGGIKFIRSNNWGSRKGEYLDVVDTLVSRAKLRSTAPSEYAISTNAER